MVVLLLAMDIEAAAVGGRRALERYEPVAAKDFGAVALLPMDDDAQNLHRNPDAALDTGGAAAPGDAFGKWPDRAIDGMHDTEGIGALLCARGYRGDQTSQTREQRQQPWTHRR